LPIGWEIDDDGRPGVVVACDPLLRQMAEAGADRALVVLAPKKWDIAELLGDGERVGLDLAYLVVRESPSTAHTVARALPHVDGATVLFGFPDLVLRPRDTLRLLAERYAAGDADVVLGLFPTDDHALFDMVEIGDRGAVQRIVIKPGETDLRLTWLAAVWGASFSDYLAEWVVSGRASEVEAGREPYVGDVVQAAVTEGLAVVGVEIPGGGYVDVGAPGAAAPVGPSPA
jgi:glucose-1-phosphate thymidylyltransferase